jgi:hypothetical protein
MQHFQPCTWLCGTHCFASFANGRGQLDPASTPLDSLRYCTSSARLLDNGTYFTKLCSVEPAQSSLLNSPSSVGLDVFARNQGSLKHCFSQDGIFECLSSAHATVGMFRGAARCLPDSPRSAYTVCELNRTIVVQSELFSMRISNVI